ncbi:MAG: hypothetical protein KC800_14315, partial [Candidatus Eremiobacteraeota bacterium]|nr:hypothetical protein [Candidatus Eremiobacteraeota bacterium]
HENQEGGVSWQYSDYTNGGQDYARQTVVEGTEISIEEFRKTTGENGEFEAGTTVKDGDDVISQSEAFKDRVNLDELTRLRNEGVVDGETYENMIRNQGPDAVYTVEHASESTEALTETVGEFQGYSGGSGQTRYPVYNQVEQLVMGEDGKPVRQGRSSSHTTVSNDTGYTESRGRDTLEGMGEIDGETVNQHGIVDPNGDPPIVIKTDKEVNGEKVDFAEGLNLGEVTVDKEGRVLVNGQEQENSDPGYLTAINDVNSLVGQSTGGYAALTAAFPNLNSSLSEISSAANGVAGAVSVGTGAYNFFTATNQEERLQGAIETVGGINGPLSIADTLLKGAGKQNSWLSKAAAFTDTFDNGVATPFARAVGVAGAVVALPGAIDDITNGPTAYHRNAGWMSAGSSALTAAGAIPSPATPFLWGGAAVLGLASLATQSVGESSTVARSEELFPGYTPAH